MTSRQFNSLILDKFLPYRLSIVNNKISEVLSVTYAKQFDLTPMEWRVLAVLGQNESISADEICRFTEIDKVAVSRAVTKLVRKKIISRKRSTSDRRRSILRLTKGGVSIYKSIVPLVLEIEANLVDGLSVYERKQFRDLLAKIEYRVNSLRMFYKF